MSFRNQKFFQQFCAYHTNPADNIRGFFFSHSIKSFLFLFFFLLLLAADSIKKVSSHFVACGSARRSLNANSLCHFQCMQSQRGTLTLQTQGIVCARAFIDYVVQSEPRGNGFVFLIFSNSCSADRAYVTEKTSSRRATWRIGTKYTTLLRGRQRHE